MQDYTKSYRHVAMRIGLAMLIFLGIWNVCSFLAAMISGVAYTMFNEVVAYTVTEIAGIIAYATSFTVPGVILLAMLKKKETRPPIFWRFHLSLSDVALIFGVISVTLAMTSVNSLLGGTAIQVQSAVTQESVSKVMEPYQIILLIISLAVTPALVEEFLFRGCILHALMPYGKGIAIVGSAILFGLMHQNPLQILYTTVGGMIMGYAYVKSESIWVGVLIHFINNLFGAMLTVIECNVEESIAYALLIGIQTSTFAVGIFCLIFVLRSEHRRIEKRYQDGSFGRILPESIDYEAKPVLAAQKIRCFFAPTVTEFVAIELGYVILSWLGTLFFTAV